MRGNALISLENIALWHERDISHSSNERVILPDSCLVLDYVLSIFTPVMKGLLVYPENMRRNLELTQGLVFSQRVLIALIDKGLSRQDAYKLVQNNAMKAWKDRTSFLGLLKADSGVKAHLSDKELESLFNYNYFTRHVDAVFSRLGLNEKKKAKPVKSGELAPHSI
jgi:adenylosuccinate lyase